MATTTAQPSVLAPTEDDMQKLLACQVHQGTRNLDPNMESYVWKRRADGINLINLGKTWEKLMLAARIIVAIENPADIVVISARPYGQRAVLKYAQYTGAVAVAGRFTPGTFTNQIQAKFMEPRLIIVTDPRTDHQAVLEASYVNIPVIALCDTDAPLRYIDCAIPCNNKGRHSIGLMYWLLAREVLRMRGVIARQSPWDVMVDLFFYRDPEEQERDEVAAKETVKETAADGEYAAETAGGDWEGNAGGQWEPVASREQWPAEDAAEPATDTWTASAPAAWEQTPPPSGY